MLTYLANNLFDSPAQTLVNTVNTVGVMGKGVAKEFKSAYPGMFKEYKDLCDRHVLQVGNLHIWRGSDRWVLNFPTKTTWRMPSKIEYIESGLQKFVSNYRSFGITSIGFPPLGCGNGNLDWRDVRPVMEDYLSEVDIPVYIHDVQVGADFVPEHEERPLPPLTFREFVNDIQQCISDRSGLFTTMDRNSVYKVRSMDPDKGLIVHRSRNTHEVIPFDEIEKAWVAMRDDLLSVDQYGDDRSRRYKSYLFPILADLPYVRYTDARKIGRSYKAMAVFFARPTHSNALDANNISHTEQCLFQDL